MKVRALIAAIFTALMVLLPVATANAADVCPTCYGSRLYVTGSSNGKVIAQNEGLNKDMWRYYDSLHTVGLKDVDYFWVPGGCDATSQYNYVYAGNRWYGPLNDTVNISLTVIC